MKDFKTAIPVLAILLGLAGCKKNSFVLDYSGIQPIIIIPNSNWPGKSIYDPQPADSTFGTKMLRLYARVSYADPLKKDVKVTFKQNTTLLESYNTRWLSNYLPLPEDAYRTPSLELTIPAGNKQAFIPIEVLPDKIAGPGKYFIAFDLISAEDETVAANAKTIVFTLNGE